MPATGLWLRQKIRILRDQPVGVQALAAGTAVLVVAGAITLGGMALSGGDDDADDGSVEAVSPEEAAEGAAPGDAGGTASGEGASTSLAPGTPDGGGTGGTGSNTATGTGGGGGTTNEPSSPGEPGATTSVPLKLTASDRGVTASTVKIVTPWFNIDQASKITGTTTDEPLEDAELVIKSVVDAVNKDGGIAGRKLEAQIEEFNPINEVDMRARCQRWTREEQNFAVVDSEAWHSTHQLCITQENKTPLVSSFTSVSEFTRRGDPYLWWTGPSAEDVIPHWSAWALDAGYLASGKQTAVLLADRADDTIMKNVFKAAFSKLGITAKDRCEGTPQPRVCFETIPFDNAAAQPAALSAVSRMKPFVDNVMTVLPLTTFTFYLNAAETQEYFPQYLGSDLAQTLVVADSILGSQFPRALHKMRGPTYAYLGGGDEPNYQGAGEKRCNAMWKAAQPKADVLDRAGVGMRWCQNILAFVEGARRATVAGGGSLTRKGWAAAMGTIKGFDGAMTPKLSWSVGDGAGADLLKIIELRTDNSCPGPRANPDDPTCFVEASAFGPIRRL